jgi:hypothetical protein
MARCVPVAGSASADSFWVSPQPARAMRAIKRRMLARMNVLGETFFITTSLFGFQIVTLLSVVEKKGKIKRSETKGERDVPTYSSR